MKLIAKIFITGQIIAETGLHIGGSKSALDIGGVDLNVIKSAHGIPFIPGSSLKGKLRSMLGRLGGHEDVKQDSEGIKEIFGDAGENNDRGKVTRLLVRDAALNVTDFDTDFADKELEFDYSETKWENTINRKTGTAQHPRQLERVPSGAKFSFELVYDVYDDGKEANHLKEIRTAMRLLEGDYIGGSGSRGYGKISFERSSLKATKKTVAIYEGNNVGESFDFSI